MRRGGGGGALSAVVLSIHANAYRCVVRGASFTIRVDHASVHRRHFFPPISSQPMPHPQPTLPKSVRLAALLIVAYGVLVVLNAVVAQSGGEWGDPRSIPRALFRLAGCGLVVFGLLQARRWAWWAAVVLGGSEAAFWAAMALGAVVLAWPAGVWDRMGISTPVLVPVWAGLLAAAVALLLPRASRGAFR